MKDVMTLVDLEYFKVGIFFKPNTNRDYAKKKMFEIADKYLNAEKTSIVETKDYIRLSDTVNIVELFFVDEKYLVRAKRFHQIYVDKSYNINFINECLLPLAHLPCNKNIVRLNFV